MASTSIPLTALDVKPPADVLSEYAKVMGIKSMMLQQQNQQQEMQQRQALMPGQQQLQQAQIVGAGQQNEIGAADVQLKNIQVKDQQLLSQPYPQFTKKTPTENSSTTPTTGPVGYDFDGLKNAYVNGGGSFNGLKQINDIQSQNADLTIKLAGAGEATIKQHQAVNSALNDAIETLQAIPDPQARAKAMPAILTNLQKMGIDTSNLAQQQPTDENLARAQAALGQHQEVINDATKLLDLQKGQLQIQKPTGQQIDTFTKKTLPSFANVTQAQRNSFASEAAQARTVQEFNAVVERADATDKSMQMHADSLAQTKALVGNKFGESGLTANEKIWTDPQRGFAGALSQANQTKASIVAGANGNALLTAMVPTMEVLGINHAAGISRISPQEAQAAGQSPEWATRWNAWATKAATGKLTPELAKEGQQLMDIVVDATHARAVQSSQLIAKGHGLAPEQTPAMDKQGNVTTLDKVVTGAPSNSPAAATQSPSAAAAPVRAKFYTRADIDAAVAANPGMSGAQIEAAFLSKGWKKK